MFKRSLSLLVISAVVLMASDANELLQKKCASCHMLESPNFFQLQKLKAPAMDAVVFHVKLAKESPKAQKAFIVDYVLNPDASKSVCESNKVAKFGVMPSQKGNVTKAELEEIADYLVKTYPHKDFAAMIKEVQANDKIRALTDSPFLINSNRLPHLTKLLVKHWDKGALGLTPQQKKKLLVIRKETLGALKQIKAKLKPLEDEVAEAMIDREDPKSVTPLLEKIAKLKIEATKVHLKCISDTTSVLTEEQVAYLLPFWE